MKLRVKEICKAKGVTMEKVAIDIGIHPNTLTRNINGNPTVETLERIASVLNVPINELFEPDSDLYGVVLCKGVVYKIDSDKSLDRLCNEVYKVLPIVCPECGKKLKITFNV